jgi:pyrroline-5-carboxylate reductase
VKVQSVGFVGGGRVARIMLEGWRRADALPTRVVVSDPSAATLEALQAQFPSIETCLGDNCAAAGQSVVMLGLHPPAFADSLPALAGALGANTIVVSLAPKLTIERLTDLLGGFDRIVRVIPNAPSIVGSGFNPVTFGAVLGDADRAVVMDLLAPLGDSPVVDEGTLEAYAITAAMGPTYLWFQFYELRNLARSFGLSETAAAIAVEQMTRGALNTMDASGLEPADVMDLVAVHPLGDAEALFLDNYRTRLAAVMDRIRPA